MSSLDESNGRKLGQGLKEGESIHGYKPTENFNKRVTYLPLGLFKTGGISIAIGLIAWGATAVSKFWNQPEATNAATHAEVAASGLNASQPQTAEPSEPPKVEAENKLLSVVRVARNGLPNQKQTAGLADFNRRRAQQAELDEKIHQEFKDTIAFDQHTRDELVVSTELQVSETQFSQETFDLFFAKVIDGTRFAIDGIEFKLDKNDRESVKSFQTAAYATLPVTSQPKKIRDITDLDAFKASQTANLADDKISDNSEKSGKAYVAKSQLQATSGYGRN